MDFSKLLEVLKQQVSHWWVPHDDKKENKDQNGNDDVTHQDEETSQDDSDEASEKRIHEVEISSPTGSFVMHAMVGTYNVEEGTMVNLDGGVAPDDDCTLEDVFGALVVIDQRNTGVTLGDDIVEYKIVNEPTSITFTTDEHAEYAQEIFGCSSTDVQVKFVTRRGLTYTVVLPTNDDVMEYMPNNGRDNVSKWKQVAGKMKVFLVTNISLNRAFFLRTETFV